MSHFIPIRSASRSCINKHGRDCILCKQVLLHVMRNVQPINVSGITYMIAAGVPEAFDAIRMANHPLMVLE